MKFSPRHLWYAASPMQGHMWRFMVNLGKLVTFSLCALLCLSIQRLVEFHIVGRGGSWGPHSRELCTTSARILGTGRKQSGCVGSFMDWNQNGLKLWFHCVTKLKFDLRKCLTDKECECHALNSWLIVKNKNFSVVCGIVGTKALSLSFWNLVFFS